MEEKRNPIAIIQCDEDPCFSYGEIKTLRRDIPNN